MSLLFWIFYILDVYVQRSLPLLGEYGYYCLGALPVSFLLEFARKKIVTSQLLFSSALDTYPPSYLFFFIFAIIWVYIGFAIISSPILLLALILSAVQFIDMISYGIVLSIFILLEFLRRYTVKNNGPLSYFLDINPPKTIGLRKFFSIFSSGPHRERTASEELELEQIERRDFWSEYDEAERRRGER